jgi:hypothetical protein
VCCCRLGELWDHDARAYADGHLERTEVRAEGWEFVYMCPTTGARWVEDRPRSEEHGGGPPRLREVADAG